MIKKRIIVISIAILIVLAVAIYFTFFYSIRCKDISCFEQSLEKCKKASYVNDAGEATWLYKIKGKSSGQCEIEASVLQIKEGAADMTKLENKKMTCLLPLGLVTSPESNLKMCSGPLKEQLQEMIIEKMHSYIIENLGKISEELTKAL